MMKGKVLISFCNPPENSKDNLIVLDVETGNQECLLEIENGVTGISQDNNFIYALAQNKEKNIFIFDKSNFSLILNQKLEHLADPHSLFVDENFLYIASTGNDQILKYKFDKNNNEIDFVEFVWKPEDSIGEKDTHHINSIFKYNNEIFISAFGKKEVKWSSAKNGYIFNITKNKKEIENIFHPHALFIQNRNFYYCESATRSVKKNKKRIITLPSGYTRGMCLEEKNLFLGTSSGRKNSKSTGEINNPSEEGILEEDCRLLIYSKNLWGNYRQKKEFSFYPKHSEIYDIISIE